MPMSAWLKSTLTRSGMPSATMPCKAKETLLQTCSSIGHPAYQRSILRAICDRFLEQPQIARLDIEDAHQVNNLLGRHKQRRSEISDSTRVPLGAGRTPQGLGRRGRRRRSDSGIGWLHTGRGVREIPQWPEVFWAHAFDEYRAHSRPAVLGCAGVGIRSCRVLFEPTGGSGRESGRHTQPGTRRNYGRVDSPNKGPAGLTYGLTEVIVSTCTARRLPRPSSVYSGPQYPSCERPDTKE